MGPPPRRLVAWSGRRRSPSWSPSWRWSSWGSTSSAPWGSPSRVRRASGRRRRPRLRARSDALWQEGLELERAGRYAEAGRALYLSALYALEEHDLLSIQEGETNQEHARRAARAAGAGPELGDTFQELVRRYDRLRYGHVDVDRPAVEELRRLVAQTRARLRRDPGWGRTWGAGRGRDRTAPRGMGVPRRLSRRRCPGDERAPARLLARAGGDSGGSAAGHPGAPGGAPPPRREHPLGGPRRRKGPLPVGGFPGAAGAAPGVPGGAGSPAPGSGAGAGPRHTARRGRPEGPGRRPRRGRDADPGRAPDALQGLPGDARHRDVRRAAGAPGADAGRGAGGAGGHPAAPQRERDGAAPGGPGRGGGGGAQAVPGGAGAGAEQRRALHQRRPAGREHGPLRLPRPGGGRPARGDGRLRRIALPGGDAGG